MHTTKVFTSVIAALTLMYSSGCCDSNCYTTPPAGVDCPPVAYTASAVTYEPAVVAPVDCPPPKPPKVKKAKRTRADRRQLRAYADPCDPCGASRYPVVAYAGTATFLETPASVPAAKPAVRKKRAANDGPVVLQRGRKGRKVVDRPGAGKTARPAAQTVGATVGPVYTLEPAPAVAASDSYSLTSLAPAKPVEAVVEAVVEVPPEAVAAKPVEPAREVIETLPEPVVEQPSYAKYLDTSAPAVVAPAPPAEYGMGGDMSLVPTVDEMRLTPGMILEAPVAAQPVAQPVVIQPIIQPVVSPLPGPAQIQGQTAMPLAPPPAHGSWIEAGLVSSAYCPPEICPVPNAALCAPGQSLSECFTLSENQLLNSPQIYTPDALNPLLPLAPAPVQAPVQAVPAPQAMAVPDAAPAMPGKYAALTPPPEIPRDARRPELSLPAPLGGDNMPIVPGTDEIEKMLDAMVPPPTLK